MLYFAPIYRFCFLPWEVKRTGYIAPDQSKLSDDPQWQKVLCAPSADLDAMMHLDHQKHFLPTSSSQQTLQESSRVLAAELVKDMGTRSLAQVNPGTEPDELISGTEKFLKDHGKKIGTITWLGWGAGQTERKGSNRIPYYNRIAKQLTKTNNEVILQVGMYEKLPNGDYRRVSGHYVTCTGFNKSDLSLKIDDPSPRAERKELSIKTQTIWSGKLIAETKNQKARGYIALEKLDLPEGADIAIVDGAFGFNII